MKQRVGERSGRCYNQANVNNASTHSFGVKQTEMHHHHHYHIDVNIEQVNNIIVNYGILELNPRP